ncbi:hypothetical protein EG68_12041, partial [Paragonimus skrjabini miyazakii]
MSYKLSRKFECHRRLGLRLVAAGARIWRTLYIVTLRNIYLWASRS